MTQERKQALLEAGIAVENALERCMGNEMLLERLLDKFAEDKTYAELLQAMSEKNQALAVRAAHTLKGVCGNLSMERLYHLLEKQVEVLRRNDWDSAKELMPAITQAYQTLVLVTNAFKHKNTVDDII